MGDTTREEGSGAECELAAASVLKTACCRADAGRQGVVSGDKPLLDRSCWKSSACLQASVQSKKNRAGKSRAEQSRTETKRTAVRCHNRSQKQPQSTLHTEKCCNFERPCMGRLAGSNLR